MPDRIPIPTPKVSAESASDIGAQIVSSVASSGHDMSVINMFVEADIVVKLVIIALVAASFWSWTIIFDKLKRFRIITKKMKTFENRFWSDRSSENFSKLYEKAKQSSDNPMANVFVAGMYEWKKNPEDKRMIFHVMDMERNREISSCEKNIPFLATVGSSAPFVGLFGTVWGIMNSFQAIAASKNTSLAIVAPGIAEALFATAVGLFAAIPAVIFYNKLRNDVANFSDRVDEFYDEFSATIERNFK